MCKEVREYDVTTFAAGQEGTQVDVERARLPARAKTGKLVAFQLGLDSDREWGSAGR